MAESNQNQAQAEPSVAHFGPDNANAGQNGAYQFWQVNPAGIASSSGRDRGIRTSAIPYTSYSDADGPQFKVTSNCFRTVRPRNLQPTRMMR